MRDGAGSRQSGPNRLFINGKLQTLNILISVLKTREVYKHFSRLFAWRLLPAVLLVWQDIHNCIGRYSLKGLFIRKIRGKAIKAFFYGCCLAGMDDAVFIRIRFKASIKIIVGCFPGSTILSVTVRNSFLYSLPSR